MHADFSVELGRDDAALELPWSSADEAVRFYDLKKNPELLRQIPEAVACPELGAFLTRINAAEFPLATAKCDMWQSREVSPEEEIYGDRKFVSYIDLVFEDKAARCSFEKHEAFAKTLCRLLGQAPEIPAAVEVVIRRCYFHGEGTLGEITAGEVGAAGEVEVAEMAGDVGGGEVEKIDGEVITSETATDEGGDAAEARGDDKRSSGAADGGDRAETNDEQQSGAANKEGVDRATASVRPRQQADIGERSVADIDGEQTAGGLDEIAEDEHVVLNDPGAVSGFYFTAYVSGFGDSDHEPRLRWQIALALLQNALVQLARDEA